MFPILYKLDANSKERMWQIEVAENEITTTSGCVNGKKVISKRTFSGKNLGKKNETTPEEQAMFEAERKWISQLDKNYEPKTNRDVYEFVMEQKRQANGQNRGIRMWPEIGETSAPKCKTKCETKETKCETSAPKYNKSQPNPQPMLASEWKQSASVLKHFGYNQKTQKFSNGVFVQPKLDGWRCIASYSENQVVLTSRSGKEFPFLFHLKSSLQKVFKKFPNVILDGELYTPCLYNFSNEMISKDSHFQTLSSIFAQKKKPHSLENQIQFHVFDLIDSNKPQTHRLEFLKDISKTFDSSIVLVNTEKVYDFDQISEFHGKCIQEDYEGIILREPESKYEVSKRSLKLRKYKYFNDAEYPIVGIEKQDGVDSEHFVWICEKDGKRFSVKPSGTKSQRIEWYTNFGDYQNQLLTVRYQELLSNGIPRFPTGKAIRNPNDM